MSLNNIYLTSWLLFGTGYSLTYYIFYLNYSLFNGTFHMWDCSKFFRSALVCMKAWWKLYKFFHHPSLEYRLLFGHRVCPFHYEDAEARAAPSRVLQEALYWCRTVSFYRGGPIPRRRAITEPSRNKPRVGCKWSLEAAHWFVFAVCWDDCVRIFDGET